MATFRKKPVVVEAFQVTRERHRTNVDWPQWLHDAWSKQRGSEGAVWPSCALDADGTRRLCIGTLEGAMLVNWDGWIIKGVQGELYPCKPDIFEKTYQLLAAEVGEDLFEPHKIGDLLYLPTGDVAITVREATVTKCARATFLKQACETPDGGLFLDGYVPKYKVGDKVPLEDGKAGVIVAEFWTKHKVGDTVVLEDGGTGVIVSEQRAKAELPMYFAHRMD